MPMVAVLILLVLLLSGLPAQRAEAIPATETEWVHHKWEQSGRTLYNPDTGQYKYVSYVGQTNVDLGDGNYAPYVWNPVTKVVRFADCQLRFFNPHFEFWRNGTRLTTARFQLLKKVGTDWVNVPVVFDGLTVNEGDEYATATMKLRDENGNEITVNILLGMFHYINLDFEVGVNIEGEYRLQMENTGLSGDPVEIHSGTGINGEEEDRVIGIVYEKMYFRWSYDEAPDRLYLHEIQPDGSETSRKIVELGTLSSGESRLISPDTWGPTAIQADVNDGEEDGRGTAGDRWQPDGFYDDDANFLGWATPYPPCPYEIGWRWDNIVASGAALDGCSITLTHADSHTESGASDATLYGIDEPNAVAFDSASSSTWPSNRNITTAYVDWDPPAETANNTHEIEVGPEIKTIIQELLDSYTYTGTQAMAFSWVAHDTGSPWWRNYGDLGHPTSAPAKLTIVYTPPPGADFTATPRQGPAPLTVQFADLSTGDITLWLWHFGDGETSTEQNPSHIYNTPGTYIVTLSVEGPGGTDSEVKTDYIEVLAAVAPVRIIVRNLQIQPAQAYPGEQVVVSADVVNQGGIRGSKNIDLVINGQAEQSTRVGVDPGTAQHITFYTSKTVPGTYEVYIEGQTSAFNVLLRPHVASTGASGGLDTGAIIAIVVIGVIFLVGIIIVFIFVRR